jgi:hydroxymethylglutaryl-CoA reductase
MHPSSLIPAATAGSAPAPAASSAQGGQQSGNGNTAVLLSKFYEKTQSQRLAAVAAFANLTPEEVALIQKPGNLEFSQANRIVENVIGTYSLPMAVATHFVVDGKEYLVPFVLEEASVVAAASNSARMARLSGGFSSSATDPLIIAQVQVVRVPNMERAVQQVRVHEKELVELADKVFPSMKQFGGGAKRVEARPIDTPRGAMLIVHLIVDVRDAMGANSVNSMAEGIAPRLEALTGGIVRLRILTNLAVLRTFKARGVWKASALGEASNLPGPAVVDAILDAWAFAAADPFRAATHNKGIMNGISAVTVATGNDWRAVEAGAHSFASYNRRYQSLTTYYKDANGDLVGEIELPLAVGKIGGATGTIPLAKISLKILKVDTAQELGRLLAAVGLAQNLAALRALATEGINRGHMKLHAKAVAQMAGATGDLIDVIAMQLHAGGKVDVVEAKRLITLAEEQKRAKL